MTEILSDQRFFGNGPVISYRPTPAVIARLAPPPPDPAVKVPASRLIALQPAPKTGQYSRQGRRQRVSGVGKARRFPQNPDNCTHAVWARNGLTETGGWKVRCSGCGTNRRLTIEAAMDLIAGRVPCPPKQISKGRERFPEQHGTHRQYKHGCRCEICMEFRRKCKREEYARQKAGGI